MDEKPVVYILHGDDGFAMEQFAAAMLARMGDPGLADLNITRLDGRSADDEEIRTAAMSIPFLSDRRLVIIHNPLAKLNSDAARKRFIALLDGLPQTTALVLVAADSWGKKGANYGWLTLHGTHWLVQWAQGAGKRALLREFRLPQAAEMPAWIMKCAREHGGQFTPPAAQALANLIGSDPQLASQEIDKLLMYVDFQRAVEAEDVAECTASVSQVSVFDMVDALAGGDATAALRLLRGLLEEGDAMALFGAITSHFRQLLLAREILDEGGGPAQVMEFSHKPKFVVDKLVRQAGRFSTAGLEAIYRKLDAMDRDAKNGQVAMDLALDLLIAEMRVG